MTAISVPISRLFVKKRSALQSVVWFWVARKQGSAESLLSGSVLAAAGNHCFCMKYNNVLLFCPRSSYNELSTSLIFFRKRFPIKPSREMPDKRLTPARCLSIGRRAFISGHHKWCGQMCNLIQNMLWCGRILHSNSIRKAING